MTATTPDGPLLRRTRWRLLAWSGGSTLIVLVVLGAAIYLAVARALEAEAINQLRQRAAEMTVTVDIEAQAHPHIPTPVGARGAGVAFLGPYSGTLGLLVGPGELVLGMADVDEDFGLPYAPGVATARQGEETIETTTLSDVPVRVLSRPLVAPDHSMYVVQVVGDRGPEERALGTLLLVLVIGGGAVLGAALLVGHVYSGRALVPIRDSLRRQREFAADVSHELRTPLTVVRATASDLDARRDERIAAAAPDLETMIDQVDHMTELIDELLLFARAESGAIELADERVDLADSVAGATRRLQRLAERAPVRLQADLAPAEVRGDARRLEQLVGILVENAIRHAPPGSAVVVRMGIAANRAQLDVEDEGPGIPTADLERIFDRFRRGINSRPGGVGLGLAIARWIVERHGGSIRAMNRPDGGARFSVTLPLAA